MAQSIQTFLPGDIDLQEITLYKGDKQISLKAQLQQISIYEDLGAPTMMAELELIDHIGLRSSFPILGEENVRITFKTPSTDVKSPVTFEFAVASVEDIQILDGARGSRYTLRLISEEMRWNAVKNVEISYTNMPISDIVASLITKDLESTKSVYLSPTKGTETIVIPFQPPLMAIDFLRRRAVSTNPGQSLYVFFENRAGFHFRTIEDLNEIALKYADPGKHFTNIPNIKHGKDGDALGYRNIIDFQQLEDASAIERLQSGTFRNVVAGFDIFTKQYTEQEFDLRKKMQTIRSNDKGALLPHSSAFIEKYGTKSPGIKMFTPTDSSRPPNFKQSTLGGREAIAAIFNTNLVKVMIWGDSTLTVGDSVYLDIKKQVGDTKGRDEDRFQAGKYIVVRLRHIISGGLRSNHQVVMECAKMGVAK